MVGATNLHITCSHVQIHKSGIRHSYSTATQRRSRYPWNSMNLPRAVKLTQRPLQLGIAILNQRSTSSHPENLPSTGQPSGMLMWRAVSSHPPMQDYHRPNVDDGLALHNERRNQSQKRRCKISGPQTPLLYWSTFWYPSSICSDEDVDRQKSKSACISEG